MVRILSVDEIEELEEFSRMDSCGFMVKLIVRMGLRQGEALDLRVADYDFAANRLRIPGANERSLTVPEEMRFPLMRLIHGRAPEAYVVSTRIDGSRQLGARTFQAYLGRIGGRLGISGLSVNTLRATCIVRFLEAGVDPARIQKELGIRARKSIVKYREIARPPVILLPAAEPETVPDFDPAADRPAVGQ